MFENKTIGEAKYLQKGNGDYIPFRIRIKVYKCETITPIIE